MCSSRMSLKNPGMFHQNFLGYPRIIPGLRGIFSPGQSPRQSPSLKLLLELLNGSSQSYKFV